MPTAIVYQSECRYGLAEFADAIGVGQGTAFSRNEVLTFPGAPVRDEVSDEPATVLTPEELGHRVEMAEGTRAVLEAWIKRTMKPGLHYGIIPVDG